MPVATLPSGSWRAAAPTISAPAHIANTVLGLFGADPEQAAPRAAPPPPRPRTKPAPRQANGDDQPAPRAVHGLETLLPPEDIPTGGTKRAARRAAPRDDERNIFEKLFGGRGGGARSPWIGLSWYGTICRSRSRPNRKTG